LLFVPLAVLLVSASATKLGATVITADGSYHEFRFQTATQDVVACMSGGSDFCTASINPAGVEHTSSPPWTFTGPAVLFVVDVGDKGDLFSAYDNLVLAGSTTNVPNAILNNNSCGFDIGCAIADAGYSRGTFLLSGGSHSLTIQVTQNALGTTGGNAFFSLSPRTDASVPEPTTLMLLTSGLLALGIWNSRLRCKGDRPV